MDRIRAQFKAESAAILKRERGVSMSIGVAAMHVCHPASADQLMASADGALYASKQAGRDRVTRATGAVRLLKVPA